MANNIKPLQLKGFTVVHLNIRSLLRHKDETFFYLGQSDVICLSETWLNPNTDDPLITQVGYKYIRQDRTYGNLGGGLLIYVKEPIAPFVDMLPEFSHTDKLGEELWVQINKPGRKKTILGLIYRPPSGKGDQFIARMNDTLNKIGTIYNLLQVELMVLGDFNVNYALTQNAMRVQLNTIMCDSGLRQVIRNPTRVTNKTSSLIDLIFTNIKPILISETGVMNICISDHMPVYISRKAPRHKHPKKVVASRRYENFTKEKLGAALFNNPRWLEFWEVKQDPNKLWGILIDIIRSSIDELCPIRNIVIRSDQLPWVDKDLRKKIEAKDRQYIKARRTKSHKDWEIFRRSKSSVRKLFIKKKRDYILVKLEETKDEPRLFWKEMDKNLRVGKAKSTTSCCDRIKDVHGNIVTGDSVSGAFNHFYVNIGQDLSRQFPTGNQCITRHIDVRKQCSFRFVGMKELKSIIKKLKNNKSTCLYNMNMQVFKEALLILLLEFTHLINECLNQSIMPTEWKVGTVSPIPKGTPSLNLGDYRPISVLPAPSKIIERVVYNQLVYYLECRGLLDNRQHGFRNNHSTASAVMEVAQFLYEGMDMGNTTHCAFIDYSKAFDTINHELLCLKLQNLGFDRQVVGWCRNYLSERTQSVKNNSIISPMLPITCGVPQGSILGPLFFIIYVNDLLELFMVGNVSITLYADDTVLYVSHKDSAQSARYLEEGLSLLANWCVTNKLTINVKKTKHMIVSPSHSVHDNINVTLNGEHLDLVHNYNYLGVVIDDRLTFVEFLKLKCNKTNVRVYQLGKIRKYLKPNIAALIYKQTILPIIEYADLMVESGPREKVARLQTLQDRAIRIIDNRKHRDLDSNMLATLYRLQPLEIRRAEHLSAMMYRLSKEDALLENSRPKIHLRSRNKVKFKLFHRRYEKYLKSPMSRGVVLWDRIPESVQRSTTKVKFKKALRPYLTDLLGPMLR